MFTLAQYVFGIGKAEESGPEAPTPQTAPSDDAFFESDASQCVQTNIEDDWILVEVGDENSNVQKMKSRQRKSSKCPTPPATSSSPEQLAPAKPSPTSKSKSKSSGKAKSHEKWVVDPPECFKPQPLKEEKKLERTYAMVAASAVQSAQTSATAATKPSVDDSDAKENLLIENLSSGLFDSTFDRVRVDESLHRPTAAVPKCDAVQPKAPKSPKTALATVNRKQTIVAVVAKADSKKRKRSITRKHHERQNRVTVQRNGPIIRSKKMFARLNAAYQCKRGRC